LNQGAIMNSISFNEKIIFPSKIICVGRNYHDHILELNNTIPEEIVIFNKPNSSIHKDIRFIDNNCHFETELSFLIMNSKLSGIAIGFDFTKRELQKELKNLGLPWEKAKAFDGSSVFTNFIQIKFPLDDIHFKLLVNNEIKQEGYVDKMINFPDQIIKKISTFMTIEDGDIVMTGTPKGVSGYKKNDHFHVKLFLKEDVLISQEWLVK